jgi:hypothetical protein
VIGTAPAGPGPDRRHGRQTAGVPYTSLGHAELEKSQPGVAEPRPARPARLRLPVELVTVGLGTANCAGLLSESDSEAA